MAHERGSVSSGGGEEAKDGGVGGQQASSTDAAFAAQPTQCCVFFAPQAWSRRYGEEFYTACITSAQAAADGTNAYFIALRCATSEWSVERPYSAFRRLASDVSASHRAQAGGGSGAAAASALPADKGDVGDMQAWMEATLQRKDASRLPAVRLFLDLDTPIQHAQQQQHDDEEEDEQQTALEEADGESKHSEAVE